MRNRTVSSNLAVKYIALDNETHIRTEILYMGNIANPEVIKEIEKRIKEIRSDAILAPKYIEEFIEDVPFSPFPQLLNTERPNRVKSNLWEGICFAFGRKSHCTYLTCYVLR